ncbi:MAG: hypothetical protein ACOY3P_07670 [Planctomycetota bacterium]
MAVAIGVTIGCQPESKQPTSDSPPPDRVEQSGTPAPAGKQPAPVPPSPPPPPTIPEVVLSESLKATGLVNVGDVMPEGSLTRVDGESAPPADMLGPRLTVVHFWTGTSDMARLRAEAAVGDLARDVVKPFGSSGVRAVSIYVGEPPDEVEKVAEAAGDAVPVLVDRDGSYFAKIAKSELPRVYLLGADRKILWFDVEYSQATERQLLQAIAAVLAKDKQDASASSLAEPSDALSADAPQAADAPKKAK